MADPTSKSQIYNFMVPPEGDVDGHRPFPSHYDIAVAWVIVEQLNVLRALHGLPEITKGQAWNEIQRIQEIIDNLPEDS